MQKIKYYDFDEHFIGHLIIQNYMQCEEFLLYLKEGALQK